jgi:outer membrane protein
VIAEDPARSLDISLASPAEVICSLDPRTTTVTLASAVEAAVCHDRDAVHGWLAIKAAVAERGIARANIFPTVVGHVVGAYDNNSNDVPGNPLFAYSTKLRSTTISGDLLWTLFDFGVNQDKIRSASVAIAAAVASTNAAVESVAQTASSAYFDEIDAKAALEAAIQGESLAAQSEAVALGRYHAGVASNSDVLQARAAVLSAQSKRVSAEGDLNVACGALNVLMGIEPQRIVEIAYPADRPPSSPPLEPIKQLIDAAERDNPALAAARAQLGSALSNYDAATKGGYPVVSLHASRSSRFQRSASAQNVTGLFASPPDSDARDRTLEIRVDIPIFAGMLYRERRMEALALARQAENDVAAAERDVENQVWKAYQLLRAASLSSAPTEALVKTAEESSNVAIGRYTRGVGSITDVLSTAATLQEAREQLIVSRSKWRRAKIQLVASLGQLVDPERITELLGDLGNP